MNVEEAVAVWHRERRWLAALDAWVDAGKPQVEPSLSPVVAELSSLPRRDAKQKLREYRNEMASAAFVRVFAAFERDLRVAFSRWLLRRMGSPISEDSVEPALPESLKSVVDFAAAMEPTLSQSQRGYVTNVRVHRNTLVHGGFPAPLKYDPEEVAHRLSDVVAVFQK